MIFRERVRARVNCDDLDFFFDDLTDYIVFKAEKLRNGQYAITILKKKLKR